MSRFLTSVQHGCRLFAAIALALCVSSVARAQQTAAASVTFYDAGRILMSGLPRSHNGIFYGCLFDGETIAVCMQRNLFVTFHVEPGSHVFSASYSHKHPAENSQLPLLLEPGHHYFVRVVSVTRGSGIIETDRGFLEVVSCEKARQEAEHHKSVPDNYIKGDYKMHADTSAPFPTCP